MLNKENLIREISTLLSTVTQKVKFDNNTRNYDINKNVQVLFAEILNIIYGYRLVDLDSVSNINQPAIDIGDKYNGVCFQITSDNSLTKIKDTLKKFDDHELYVTYHVLNHLIIGDKKIYRGQIDKYENFKFSINENVIDTTDLMKIIGNISDIDKLQKIKNCLSIHISNESQILNYNKPYSNVTIGYPSSYSGILKFMGHSQGTEGYEEEKIYIAKFIEKFSGLDVNIRSITKIIIENKVSFDDQGINFLAYPLMNIIESNPIVSDTLFYMNEIGLVETPDDTGTSYSRLCVDIEIEDHYRIDYLNIIMRYSESKGIPISQWVINMDFSFLDKV